ncbi:MAG: hypothetical protein H6811_08630 [Phycisphaeraceae bacterium]|nr:hypothetical protein [Phycisphaeraceae bacterium]
MRDRIEARAWAKVNLALSVHAAETGDGPRRGWHRIDGWFHAVDLFDDIVIQRQGHADLITRWAHDAPCPSPIDWAPEQDLAWRARHALERATARDLCCRIAVTKRIPVGGGLGGGSSDAAATLLALCDLFELGLSDAELREIGGSLGSDVAFFLDDRRPPRPALVGGFGDDIQRLDPLCGELLLMMPAVRCATPGVYREFDRIGGTTRLDRAEIVGASDSRRLDGALCFNDLAEPAMSIAPPLRELIAILARHGARPIVTGSGSCLFVPLEGESEARIDRWQGVLGGLGVAALRARLV